MSLEKKLKYIEPSEIEFDKNNPRGLSEEQITRDPIFKILVASIQEYGILEPIIVKPNDDGGSVYVLIDGERRLRAAIQTEQSTVPALIAKNDIDGRILAYHVHMLRQDWSKAAETRAIKKMISDFTMVEPSITEAEIKKKLFVITKHTSKEIADIMKLAKYKDETIDKVLSRELKMSYLVHIEENFVTPLKKKYQDIVDSYGEDEIREILVNKAIAGKLVDTRFLMDKFKVVFKDIKLIDEVREILIEFLHNKSKAINETLEDYQRISDGKNKSMGKKKTKKEDSAATTEEKKTRPKKESSQSTFEYKRIKVTQKEQTQIEDVRGKFEKKGKSFSKDEIEYIKEALHCLELNCFKAATLMIWAAGISRILNYVGKNLIDYNNASGSMKKNPKSVYKHFATNFQPNAQSIEEVRVSSNDRQLLCYLFYQSFISETACKKLLANYNTRCDCAHPTDIELSPNEVVSLFDNIYELIFCNTNL